MVAGDPPPFPIPPGGAPRFSFSDIPPGSVEEALDRVEALAEWAGAVSGFPVSEGELWKSIRAHATLRSLLDALDGGQAYLAFLWKNPGWLVWLTTNLGVLSYWLGRRLSQALLLRSTGAKLRATHEPS